MKRRQMDYVADSGDTFRPDSIVCHLHSAFGLENEYVALMLSQHAACYIAELVAAIREMIQHPNSEDARNRAAQLAERVKSGPPHLEDDWPGAEDMTRDLEQMYKGA